MASKPKPFDTVSSGTLRDSDLLDAMLCVLEQYRPRKYAKEIKQGRDVLEKCGDFGYIGHIPYITSAENGIPSSDELDEIEWLICETLYECMDDLAPAGCYYGSHPGDGAFFGFWPYEDSDLWE